MHRFSLLATNAAFVLLSTNVGLAFVPSTTLQQRSRGVQLRVAALDDVAAAAGAAPRKGWISQWMDYLKFGAVVSLPGSGDQPVHRDGRHLGCLGSE